MAGTVAKRSTSATEPARVSVWVLPLTAILVLVVGFLFVRSYVASILFSALISFMFLPVYKYFARKTKRPGLSVAITICTATLSIIIPVLLLAALTLSQVNTMVKNYQASDVSFGSATIEQVVNTGTERVQNIVHALPGGESVKIDKQAVSEKLKDGIVDGLKLLAHALAYVGGAFFGFITTFILSIFLISSMLRYH